MIAEIVTQAGGRVVGLGDIETLCKNFELQASALDDQIAALETDLDAVKQKHLKAIKRQAGLVAAAEAELHSAVESGPHLFKKPRTLTVHGVKCGYSCSEGALAFDDGEQVVALIRKHRKDDVDTLIRTKHTPDKEALKRLPAIELAKLGCRIEGAGDQVIVKRVAGDVEKLIEKLIGKLVEAMVTTEETK